MPTFSDTYTNRTFRGKVLERYVYNLNLSPNDNSHANQLVVLFMQDRASLGNILSFTNPYAVVKFFGGRCEINTFAFSFQAKYNLASNCEECMKLVRELFPATADRRVARQSRLTTVAHRHNLRG